MKLLGLDDPTGADRKRLVTFVEIDRCATDAIPVVTGCRLGKRALKFRDFGKVAATFCDLQEDRAVRVVARESSKQRAREMHPEIAGKNAQQMQAYREMPDEAMFDAQWVRVRLGPEEFPGYKGERVVCAECGEGINFKREVIRDGRALCKPAPVNATTKFCCERAAILHHRPQAAGRDRTAARGDRPGAGEGHRAHPDPREGFERARTGGAGSPGAVLAESPLECESW